MSGQGSGEVEAVRSLRNQTMAGRYQGYHSLNTGNIEIFWRADGWWWWSRAPGYPPEGALIGPFLTSTEAYLNASGGAVLIPRPARLYERLYEKPSPLHNVR
jgi:hypothetical protein